MKDKGKKLNVWYIVNFWGGVPHNYFIRYLRENNLAKISVLSLPVASHKRKGNVVVKAFFMDEKGRKTVYQKKIGLKLPHFFRLLFHYLINFLIAIKVLVKNRQEKFDLCIGENAFNGMLALFVKKLGLAEHSIFVSVDVLPNPQKGEATYLNFPKTKIPPKILTGLNKLVVFVQRSFSRIAYKNELVWYISDRTRKRDAQQGLVPKEFIISPVAINSERVKKSHKIAKKRNNIAYMGNLSEQLGIDMAIRSLALVKKKVKDFKFVVVGGNPYLVDYYTKMAKDYGLAENVRFHGYVEDFDEAIDIIAGCKIALALYRPGTTSTYTDVSKVKNYLQAVLPIIIVKPGPDIYKEIEAYQAGVCVRYDEKQIARAILDILENRKLHSRLLKNVVSLSEKFDYKNLCSTAYKEITSKLNESK